MKGSKDFISSQGQLFNENRPILEHLIPVRIENWRREKLFSRSKKYNPWQKARFCMMIRAKAFNFISKDPYERSGDKNASPVEIQVGKIIDARQILKPVHDPQMREIMENMIVTPDLYSARYFAKKCGYSWPQFVIDFNYGLEQAMDEWYTSHNK